MTAADAAGAEALTRLIPEASSWTANAYASLLNDGAGFGLVAEKPAGGSDARRMAGFVVGRIIADEAEILNVAVDKSERRRGAGSALVEEAIKLIGERGGRRLFLEVREANEAARGLYQKHGFQAVGRRKGYYREPAEDAIILERVLTK